MTSNFSSVEGEVSIRIADPADAASVRSLRLEALSLHPEAFAVDLEITASEGVNVWAERITSYRLNSSGAIVIALAGDEVVGISGIGRGHWPKTRHFGTIWGVYVNQDWRGNHIGEKLLDGCIEWSMGNGVSVISLGVNTSNVAAIRCYLRSGFTIYGVEPRSICHNGVYIDEFLMVKLI